MSDLSVFTPLVHEVVIDGRKIEVGRFKMRQFADVQVAVRPLAPAMAGKKVGEDQWEPQWHRLVSDLYPDLRRFLVVATGVEPEWLDDQDPHDVLGLLALVMETNADFTRRRVVPALDDMAVRTAGALTGDSSSPGSASSDTAETTPST